jgi:uncharacterized damage-inducible protein DinB
MEKEVLTVSEKDQILQVLEREYQTTVKVLKAYPADKLDLKPAEKSRTARELAWNFVDEQAVIDMALKGKVDFTNLATKAPKTMKEILDSYDKVFKENINKIKHASEDDLNNTIPLPVGPGKIGDLRLADIIWMYVMDMIHHRGQLSVYNRLAGGRVPSIYGPSADEPWN